MSNRSRNSRDERVYDKYAEHLDQTPLGKLQQQYWTTKQQVIKKLGKKEDEFVVASDCELDAKLDLFEAIQQNSVDLLRVIEMYQEKLINLSVEESEMSSFLKSQSTYDTKTKAGKMMASVSKAQHFASQQRTALRLPLVRLFNEVETFRFRAITDTFITVRKMENSRTEYRGALLWMKNVSMELDPDATRKLEKFRRVQAQVKKTKTKFDRLKTDVIQKIDLLSASRCNMFSHVLASYQNVLITFWEKTARTFNTVADAYKGYQYYEFNIIKDLVEPSKKVAELVNKVRRENSDEKPITDEDNKSNTDKKDSSTLIDFDDEDQAKRNQEEKEEEENKNVDQVNELIDLMTLNEANSLNEQLKELEQLELEKKKRDSANSKDNKSGIKNPSATGPSSSSSFLNDVKLPFDFGLTKSFSFNTNINDPASGSLLNSANSNNTAAAVAAANLVDMELDLAGSSTSANNLKSFKDLMTNTNDEFEREWQAVLSANDSTNQTTSTSNNNNNNANTDNQDEFGFFVSANPINDLSSLTNSSSSLNDITSLFPSKLLNNQINNLFNDVDSTQHGKTLLSKNDSAFSAHAAALNAASTTAATAASSNLLKPDSSSSSKPIKQNASSNSNKNTWYNLFAELDPLKNPDAIGQKEGTEEERNC